MGKTVFQGGRGVVKTVGLGGVTVEDDGEVETEEQ